MLQQVGAQLPVPQIDPEDWLVSQGRVRGENPDTTSAAERAALVKKFLSDSENSEIRQEAERYWKEADRLVKGFHWASPESGATSVSGDFEFAVNMTYAIQEKMVSQLVEGIPELEFLERSPNQTDIATQIDNFFRHEWERNNWMAAFIIALEEAMKHRVGWLKVFWDPVADGNRGSVRIEPVSNYDLFLDEGAMIRDGKLEAKHIIHRMDKPRMEIIRRWKVDPSGEVQRHLGMLSQRENKTRPFLDMVRDESRGGVNAENSRPPRHAKRKDVLQVYECHYKDDELVKSTSVDANEPAQLKYPSGRILIECNGHLLYDGPNPAGFCMFVPFTIQPCVDSIYGPSIINQLAGMQMALNKSISQMIEHTERCSNPVLKISAMSKSLNQDSDIGAPGSRVVTMGSDNETGWMEPPPLGLEVKDILGLMIEFMEMVSGIHEVTQGQTGQARSGIAIERLQSAAATRSNFRSINFDQGLKTTARNIVSLFLDFVNEDRQYRFLDEDTMMEQYGTFNAETLVAPTRRDKIAEIQEAMEELRIQFSNIVRFRSPEEAEMLQEYYVYQIEELQREIYTTAALPAHDLVSFDVRIQTGTRSLTQAAQESRAFMLKEMGVLTDAWLLKLLRMPNAHRILQAKAEENEATAKAMLEQAQQQQALETGGAEAEHDNEMELAELQGQIQIYIAKLQAQVQKEVAKSRATQSKKAS